MPFWRCLTTSVPFEFTDHLLMLLLDVPWDQIYHLFVWVVLKNTGCRVSELRSVQVRPSNHCSEVLSVRSNQGSCFSVEVFVDALFVKAEFHRGGCFGNLVQHRSSGCLARFHSVSESSAEVHGVTRFGLEPFDVFFPTAGRAGPFRLIEPAHHACSALWRFSLAPRDGGSVVTVGRPDQEGHAPEFVGGSHHAVRHLVVEVK